MLHFLKTDTLLLHHEASILGEPIYKGLKTEVYFIKTVLKQHAPFPNLK